MAIRWQGDTNVPESLYITFTSLGIGIVNNTQFVALTIGAPKERMASVVSLFLLSQQLGNMFGISGGAALVHLVFLRGLGDTLSSLPHKDKVSVQKPLNLHV